MFGLGKKDDDSNDSKVLKDYMKKAEKGDLSVWINMDESTKPKIVSEKPLEPQKRVVQPASVAQVGLEKQPIIVERDPQDYDLTKPRKPEYFDAVVRVSKSNPDRIYLGGIRSDYSRLNGSEGYMLDRESFLEIFPGQKPDGRVRGDVEGLIKLIGKKSYVEEKAIRDTKIDRTKPKK